MNNLARKALLFAIAVLGLTAANAQSGQIAFGPEKPRYARGETFTIVGLVRDASGKRLANFPVHLAVGWHEEEDIAALWLWSNSAGEVRMPFRVPSNPRRDNLFAKAWSPWTSVWTERRIPIGQ